MAAKTKSKKQTLSPTRQLLLALALLVAAILASRPAGMTDWEEVVFRVLYNTPEFARPAVVVITQAGSIYAMGVLLFIFFLMHRYQSMVRLLLTGMLAYLISGFAKDIWGRLRPHELLAGVVNLDYVVRGPGFPSGHVALATALALTVGRYLPSKYKWLVPVWIISVGWSRMYLGIHAPLDVVGGFAIGWLAYALFLHVRIYNILGRSKTLSTMRTGRRR